MTQNCFSRRGCPAGSLPAAVLLSQHPRDKGRKEIMKKAILSKFHGAQEIPELETLELVEEAGTYAVTGYDKPVNVQPVTEYGAEQISVQFPQADFLQVQTRTISPLSAEDLKRRIENNEIL